jgi:hypothetical protein
VISSSSQTNGRPAAHRTRTPVFQCTPGVDGSSWSGQSRTGRSGRPSSGATTSFASAL